MIRNNMTGDSRAIKVMVTALVVVGCLTASPVAAAAFWSQLNELQASDGMAGDKNGQKVSIDGDYALVTSFARVLPDPGGDPNADLGSVGAGYMYEKVGGIWQTNETQILVPSNAAEIDQLGQGGAVSGTTAILASRRGAEVWVYDRNPGTGVWEETTSITGVAVEFFGSSVALDGDTLAVGAFQYPGLPDRRGAVFVYQRNAGGADNWGQVAFLTPSDGTGIDREFMGFSLDLDGDTIVAGARFGLDGGAETGAAYIYQDTSVGGDWSTVAETKLLATGGAATDMMGFDVGIDGNIVVAGAQARSGNTGAVYVFEDTSVGGDWSTMTETSLLGSDTDAGDAFGYSVAVDNGRIVVGALNAGTGGGGQGYVFEDSGSGWAETVILPTTPASISGDLTGLSIAVQGDVVLMGSRNDHLGSQAGSAFVFGLVPEPGTLSLLGLGFLTLLLPRRKRRS